MVVINNDSGLTEAHYSGTSLSEIYVGHHLVWPVQPSPPVIGDKFTYTISGNTSVIPCNETNILSYQEIMIDIRDNGGDMRNISGMTDGIIGDCVGEIHPLCFAECPILSSITISDNVTEIDHAAFYNCHSLSSVTIPSGVTIISESLFSGADNLSTVNIPSGTPEIGFQAFYDCLSLVDITIPSGVTKIGDSAFRTSYWTHADREMYNKMMNVANNRVVKCYAQTPPEIGDTVFSIISGSNDIARYKIYVPSESLEAYKSAQGWSEYADRLEPIT